MATMQWRYMVTALQIRRQKESNLLKITPNKWKSWVSNPVLHTKTHALSAK